MVFSRKAEGPVEIGLPSRAMDQPAWKRVGIIAAVGFAVGVAWPRLAGVRLGPAPPESASGGAGTAGAPPSAGVSSATAHAPAGSAIATSSPPPPSASLPAGDLAAAGPSSTPATSAPVRAMATSSSASSPGAGPTPVGDVSAGGVSAQAPPTVSVNAGTVTSCKTSEGDSLKAGDCGKLTGLDAIVVPRLRKLAACPEASTENGRLQLVMRVDFGRGWVLPELASHGQSVTAADALLSCAKTDLAGAALASVTHDHPRYSVSYAVTFAPNSGAPAATAGESARPAGEAPRPAGDSADATVQVAWDVALVRDAPKTGKVQARLPRGTTVRLGPVKDGWYPVQYGDGFASEGWVYRGAVGR